MTNCLGIKDLANFHKDPIVGKPEYLELLFPIPYLLGVPSRTISQYSTSLTGMNLTNLGSVNDLRFIHQIVFFA